MNGINGRIRMFAKSAFATAVVCALFLIVACGDGKNIEMPTGTPTPTPFPTPSSVAGLWTLERYSDSSGSLPIVDMRVVIYGSSIRLAYPASNWPTDSYDYAGTMVGNDFSATAEWGSFYFVGKLTGHFSNDGRHLSATEVRSYRDGTEASFNWVATKQ